MQEQLDLGYTFGGLATFGQRPFRGLWWSRFWLYLGWSMSTVYLLYFLEDRLGLPRAAALQAQTLLLGLYAAGTVASAALAGWASDRCGQRLDVGGFIGSDVQRVCGVHGGVVHRGPGLVANAVDGKRPAHRIMAEIGRQSPQGRSKADPGAAQSGDR
jgi:hypothetical protein